MTISNSNISDENLEQALLHLKKMSARRNQEKGPFEVKKTFIYPYHSHSLGAKKLAQSCDFQFYGREYIVRAFDKILQGDFIVLNWGSRTKIDVTSVNSVNMTYLNHPNKIFDIFTQFDQFVKLKDKGVSVPEFTTSVAEAISWHREGRPLFGVHRYGRSTFSEDLQQFMGSDFWMVYKKKTNEYRVHVAFGEIIAVQEKRLREKDHLGNPIKKEDVDFRIQSGENGFILRKTDDPVVDRVLDLAKNAIDVCGLDFGAVDILNNKVTKKSYVYKIRPAPLLNEDLSEIYGKVFQKKLDNLPKA